jgi:hypothetical protein
MKKILEQVSFHFDRNMNEKGKNLYFLENKNKVSVLCEKYGCNSNI